MTRTAALLVVAAVAFFVSSASAVSGGMRALYVPATWGPQSFTQDELERVAAGTDAFFRATSGGRFGMQSTVARSLRLPRAVFDSCDATLLREAAAPSTFAGFERIVFVTPPVPACQFHGEANPTEVFLNGHLAVPLAAHELGHTLGLGHASRWDCARGGCTIDEYGSGFSVMGGGQGAFNAYEEAKLEWLTGVVRPTRAGTYEIGPIDASTQLPQALVVATAGDEFWFESRAAATPPFHGAGEQPAGVAVVAGPAPGAGTSSYPRENLLLPNPAGGGRHAYAAQESFVRPGVFRVTVERHALEGAVLAFQWLDTLAPARPVVRVLSTGRRVTVSWDPARELGSGVQMYTVLVDGRVRRVLTAGTEFRNSTAAFRLACGAHRVAVFATDRAGNRGRASVVRVRVR